MTRSDAHAPKNFDPRDYVVVGWLDDDEHFGFGKRPTKPTVEWKEAAA
jgi:hypothetical protein